MKGQWIGTYSASPPALGILDLDDRGDRYSGHAIIYYGEDFPVFVAPIVTLNKADKHHLEVPVSAHRIGSSDPIPVNQLHEQFPDWTFASSATLDLRHEGNGLLVAWNGGETIKGEAIAERTLAGDPSDLKPEVEKGSWSDFRDWCLGLRTDHYVFRGQSNPTWRLRTRFHRAGRSDLYRFASEDVHTAYGFLSNHTRHRYDLDNALDYAAFLHLLQHHGFPTPLLDWSTSPFVAAYFAFAKAHERGTEETPVRVHAFDTAAWRASHHAAGSLSYVGPHITFLQPQALDNPRAQPQQSLSSFSTIDDIESFVAIREQALGVRFLRCWDFDYSERPKALRELTLMGITPATLFPGLAGACEALAIRLFGIDA